MDKQTYYLGYGVPLDVARAAVFGHLVRLATPILQAFHGDLYHDAQWIMKGMTDNSLPLTFLWSVGKGSTYISCPERYCQHLRHEHMYRLMVELDRNAYVLTIEEIGVEQR